MCNIDKLKSTFRYNGDNYRASFGRINNKIRPIIEKQVFSVLGIKFWKQIIVCKGEEYNSIDISNIEKDTPLDAVKKLRQIAMISISPSIA